MRLANSTALCLYLVLVFAANSAAQEFRGAITGTVFDQTGALVPNAKITVLNARTNISTQTISNNSGLYSLPLLAIGEYNLSLVAPGFKTFTKSLELRGGDRLQIDAVLQLESTTGDVTVTGEAELLDTTKADSGQVIDSVKVHDLPLLGRNPFMLVTNSTGVLNPPNKGSIAFRPFDNGGMDAFQISGGRPQGNEYLIDGLADSTVEGGGPANIAYVPSPDMVAEFKVQTLLYDAQFGRTTGGVVSINLKSGGNMPHGVLYHYLRNDKLNANDFGTNAVGGSKNAFRWAQPGLEFDGPVFLPKIYDGRNKTFFMFGWEKIKSSIPSPTYNTIPTLLERTGDFSQSNNGGPAIIYDPLTTLPDGHGGFTRKAFAGSIIPMSRIDPVARAINALLPQPTTNTNFQNLFSAPNARTDEYDSFATRVDQTIGTRHRLFASFVRGNRHEIQGLQGFSAAVSPAYKHWRTNLGGHLDLTSALSPTFVSSFRIGWNRHEFAVVSYGGVGVDLVKLGFPQSTVKSAPNQDFFPHIDMDSYSSFGNAGWTNSGLYTWSDTYDMSETLNKVVGRHNVKFGGEVRPQRNNRDWASSTFASFGFGKQFTQANPLAGDSVSGNAQASFLLGYPNSGNSLNNPTQAFRNTYYGLYIQDDWRVHDKLTINFGLRYDIETPQTERYNRLNTGFDPSAPLTFAGMNLKGKVTFPDGTSTPYATTWKNFGPRLGAAYRVNSKAVMRGGFGIIYAPTFDIGSTAGFGVTTPYVASNDGGLTPANTLSNPFPQGFLHPLGAQTNLLGQGGWQYWTGGQRGLPMTKQFSFGVQYQLPWQSVLEALYSGSRGSRFNVNKNPNYLPYSKFSLGNQLLDPVNNPFAGLLPGTGLNAPTIPLQQTLLPFPQYGGFTQTDAIGSTTYNSMQIRLEKRFSNGFHMLTSYTFSKTLVKLGYLNDQDPKPRQWLDSTDLPHQINISGGYIFPFFKNSSHAFLKRGIAGWQLNVIYHTQSGSLIGLPGDAESTGVNPALPNATRARAVNTCTITTSGARQNCLPSEQAAWSIRPPWTLRQLNPYTSVLRRTYPQNVDLSMFKSFAIHEGIRLEFRAESFNFTNSVQFDTPDMSPNSPNFGRVGDNQSNDPRNVQLALKLAF